MSQASSSSAAGRGARFMRGRAYAVVVDITLDDVAHPAQLAVAPPQPLDDVPPPPLAVLSQPTVDHVTGLPLIVCPECKDVKLIALNTMNSLRNLGRRFFKCPRNEQFVPGTRYLEPKPSIGFPTLAAAAREDLVGERGRDEQESDGRTGR